MRALIIIITLATVSSLPASPSSLRLKHGLNRLLKVQQIYSETISDAQLEKAILETMPEYSKEAHGKPDYRIWYYYNKVDLNGDGRPEVLVYLRGREVCGTGGCNLMVFQRGKSDY